MPTDPVATAASIDPSWPITTEDDPQRVYCSNPVCGGVDVHPHYHRKPATAALTRQDIAVARHPDGTPMYVLLTPEQVRQLRALADRDARSPGGPAGAALVSAIREVASAIS